MGRWFVVYAAACCAAAGATAGPKGVLLLIGDDHGLELGCYGHPVVRTPHLDRLAGEGVRFAEAFCTTASCSPSRSVIFTGLHNHANGQYGLAHPPHNFHMKPGVETLVEILKRHGYRTGMIGKMHVEPAERFPFDFQPKVNARDVRRMADLAAEFLAESKDAPFLLVMGYVDPHRDFGNRGEYRGVAEVKYSPDDVVVPPFLPDLPEVRADLAEYCQSVSRMDQGVGMALEALAAAGREGDTLVIYLSDNGIPFPGAKTTVYEPGIHLPLIVRAPGVSKPGMTSCAMASWVDVAPTILDWAAVGQRRRANMHGRSWLPILSVENPPGWDVVFCSHTFHEATMGYPMRVVRTRTHKLIWNLRPEVPFPFASDLYRSPTWQAVLAGNVEQYGARPTRLYVHRPQWELYDLENDPLESRNLADDPSSAELRSQLAGRLREFLDQTKDPWMEMVDQKPFGGG